MKPVAKKPNSTGPSGHLFQVQSSIKITHMRLYAITPYQSHRFRPGKIARKENAERVG
jgi:hypothetical protein